jgi:hypothetical protein
MSIAGLVVKGGVTTNATPTFSPVAGAYGPTQTVTITSATSGSTICYTTNGDTPTAATPGTCDSDSGHESSISNGGTMTVSATETVKAIGTLSGDTNSSVGSAAYTINGAASTPTFSPVAGAYSGTKNVTISCSTGPTACYNTTGSPATNGSTGCTTGTLVSGTVAVTGSETLYAVCGGTAYSDSSVGSAAYTISAATSPPLMTLIGVGP